MKQLLLTLLVFSLFVSTCFGEIHTVDTEPTELNEPPQAYINRVKQRVLKKDQPMTMIGKARLDNVEFCLKEVLKNDIPGDCVETGVWRGGATILMRAILKAYQNEDRQVWVVDSFQGLPAPNLKKYPADRELLSEQGTCFASLNTVMNNFASLNLLDNRVVFVKGWFSETLPPAPIEQIALLRLDGDLYESTMDVLNALYDKVTPGGYIIIDDYGHWKACKKAVTHFRKIRGIDDEIIKIDYTGVYWQKSQM